MKDAGAWVSGFLCLLGAIFLPCVSPAQPSASPPQLSIRSQQSNHIVLSWTTAAAGYVLDAADSLGPTTLWQAVPDLPQTNGASFTLQLDLTNSVRFYRLRSHALTTIAQTSPLAGESGVSVTRETVLRFSAPLGAAAVLSTASFYAQFGGRRLLTRPELSADRKTATLFYLENLPGSAQVQVTFVGDAVQDANGQMLDADGDGVPGGIATLTFLTTSTSSLFNTAVIGQVFASEKNPDGSNHPLEGVTVTVDGTEQTLRAVTDTNGFFTLQPAPSGEFFVHIDGRTSGESHWPNGAYYPFVGKLWTAAPGYTNNLAGETGLIYLPLIAADALQTVSAATNTIITFAPSFLATNPSMAGVEIDVPANSLFSENGERGGKVGISPVPPDRLPGPLPPGLNFALVITIQTDGAQNFDQPIPIRFPNLPDPVTGIKLPPGAKTALWSFNHDTGRWEVQGPATVTADGQFVVSDPGFGVRQPGWHGIAPGSGGGGPTCPTGDCGCLDVNNNGICDDREFPPDPKTRCKDKRNQFLWSVADFTVDMIAAAVFEPDPVGGCAFSADLAEAKTARDCTFYSTNPGDCQGVIANNYISTLAGCIPVVGVPATVWFDGKGIIDAGFTLKDCVEAPQTQAVPSSRTTPRPLGSSLDIAPEIQQAVDDFGLHLTLSSLSSNLIVQLTGSSVWTSLNTPTELVQCRAFFNQLADALAPDSPAGSTITPAERTGLLALPLPAAVQAPDASAFIDRAQLIASGGLANDPALRQKIGAAYDSWIQFASQCVGLGWQTEVDGLRRGLVNYSAALGRVVDPAIFATHRPFYALIDPDDRFILRGRVNASGQIENVILSPNRFYVAAYYDPQDGTVASAFFYSAAAGTSTSIPLAEFVIDQRPDADGDGLSDLAEAIIGTDPAKADSDGDGLSDGVEARQGSNPLDGRPAAQGAVASVASASPLTDLSITGDLLLGGSAAGAVIYDVHDPLHPMVLGQVVNPGVGKIVAVAASDSAAAMLDDSQSVTLLDLGNGANAKVLNRVSVSGANSLAAGEGRIYVGSNSKISVLDGVTGQVLSTFVGDWRDEVRWQEGILYAVGMFQSNPQIAVLSTLNYTLALVTTTPDGVDPDYGAASPLERGRKLFVGGGYAYLGTFGGFNIFDVHNPAQPTLLAHPAPNQPQAAIHSLAANGSGLLIATTSFNGAGTLGVSIYDVHGLISSTNFLSALTTPGTPRALVLHRGYALVADTTGLTTVNYLAPDSGTNPPTINLRPQLSQPPDTQDAEESFVVNADTTDDVQVRTVEFYIDNALVTTAGTYPFAAHLQAPAVSGTKTNFLLQAKVTDTGGKFASSVPLTVNLVAPTTPPVVVAITNSPRLPLGEGFPFQLTARFQKPIALASLTSGSCQLLLAGQPVAGGVITLVNQGRDAILSFPAGVSAGAYTFVLGTGITSQAGIHLTSPVTYPITVVGPKLWISDVDGDWGTPANWSGSTRPDTNDFVIIDRPAANPLVHFTAPSGVMLNARALICRENADFQATGANLAIEETAQFFGSLTVPTNATSVNFLGGGSVLNGSLQNFGRLLLYSHQMELPPSASARVLDGGNITLNWSTSVPVSELHNSAGSVLELHSTDVSGGFVQNYIVGSGGNGFEPLFQNDGELRKTGPGLSSVNSIAFQNNGLVNVLEGTLSLYDSHAPLDHYGVCQIAPLATLQLVGTHRFSRAANVLGAGTLELTKVTFNNDYNFTGLTRVLDASEFRGSVQSSSPWLVKGNATFSGLSAALAGPVTLVGGTLTINTPTEVTISSLILGAEKFGLGTIAGGQLAGSRKLRVSGAVTVTNVLTINVVTAFDGPLEILTNLTCGGYETTFNGPTVWHAGTITSSAPGSPIISSSGSFEIAPAGASPVWNCFDIVNEGTLTKTSPGGVTLNQLSTQAALRNSGLFIVGGGPLTLNGGIYLQSAGETRMAGGSIVFPGFNNVYPFQFNGGRLTGTGVLGGSIMLLGNAELSPGFPIGTLTVSNLFGAPGFGLFFGQTGLETNSQLTVEIAGPNAGTDYDQVIVDGPTYLNNSTLNITLLNGYLPNVGDKFQILTCASLDSRKFGTVTGAAFAPGKAFQVNYVTSGANRGVVLEVVTAP